MAMFDRLSDRLFGAWRLMGFDTFAGERYAIPGRYRSRDQAERAAVRRKKKRPARSAGRPVWMCRRCGQAQLKRTVWPFSRRRSKPPWKSCTCTCCSRWRM